MSAGGGLLPPGAPRSDVEVGAGPRPWDSVPFGSSAPASRFGVDTSAGPADASSDRSSRKKRIIFVGLIVALVAGLLVLALVAGSGYRNGGWYDGGSSSGGGSTEDVVRFLAVGDWGRQGGRNQSEVAALMGRVAATTRPSFIVSTGDNFYQHGLNGTDDPAFDTTFTKVYTARSLQVPWHAVLGNHDYGDSAPSCAEDAAACGYSPLHQLNMSLSSRDSRWHCERSYTMTLAGGRVQLFFIDTSPFIERYQTVSWANLLGGILQQSWQAQVLELEHRLAQSTAEWKLVIGHHPGRSNGEHMDNPEIIAHIEPLLLQYGVQAYFCGHDHNLEHLQHESYSTIVTGGGSEAQRRQVGTTESHYFYPYSGFVGAVVEGDTLTVDFYTLESGETPAHTSEISRQSTN